MNPLLRLCASGLLALLLLGPALAEGDSLPILPAGFHWQAVAPLTDEFSGKRLDPSKWQPRQPYWAGREPSRFDPANVSVRGGHLLLCSTTSIHSLTEVRDPLKDVWVQSACVASLAPIAKYGYYEARMRASDLSMTSSFWLQGKYSEIDVVEQLGHSLKNPAKGTQMLMNTHYFPHGWGQDVATPRQVPMLTGSAQAYHTYGVWWKDAESVLFYLDGKQVAEVKTGGPFGEPMYLFFDTEVFTWEGLPTVESLRDPRRNTMSVDWVRAWTPVRDEQKRAPGGVTWDRATLRPFATHAGRFYRYAPSALADGPREWCWACQNAQEGIIKDSIFLTKREGGVVKSNKPALTASAPGRWDSFHVCDPSVVGGRFRWAGQDYRYALLYLGNDVNASRHNQIGVAFAHSPDGPWTRAPEPLVAHADDGTWGVGQPSAVCTDDKGGRVLLFYTRGDQEGTRTLCREVGLQDTGKGFAVGPDVTLTSAGLTGTDGRPDILNDADFAYDPTRRRFYALREQHPNPRDYPTYIGASLQLVSLPAENARHGGVWRVEGAITPVLTGQPRNHNGGLVRTLSGTLPDPRRVRVLFTSSGAGPGVPVAEWTYDLWEITGRLAP